MKTDLKTLALSTRIYNALVKVGIDTVEKLEKMPQSELQKIKGISKKSIEEIEEKLLNNGKADKFALDKTYIFTKKKYIKAEGREKYRLNKEWVDSINGQIVDVATQTIKDKVILKQWCICK
ncbi:DNA-directed RNA polymerase subunit alpha C-terminal domain-containing protein [Clostridium disporicum]|uniref:DNA-directed RNA polymerase subunit alpha C-terminal domain-containing protein n=1 Tax=Clostridium disporicum TaxID=84024 RepID=UPI0034A23F94